MTNDLATLENINLDNLDESALMALTGTTQTKTTTETVFRKAIGS